MKLVSGPTFNGYPIINQHGPLIERMLIGNEEVVRRSLDEHTRVAVLRCELKFPSDHEGSTEVISKFFDSLRYKLKNDLRKKTESRGRVIHSHFGYVWVKELSNRGGWHYHVALFFNYDVYNCFGKIGSPSTNMYNRMLSSWANVIGRSMKDSIGLVEIPPNPVYKLDRRLPLIQDDINTVLFRLSYFAKVKTKPFGGEHGMRFYGTSKR